MRALRHESNRRSVHEVDDDGVRPIVVALPDDTVGTVMNRVHRYGVRVNVVVPDAADNLFMLSVLTGRGADSAQGTEEPCDIHEDSPIGMLLSLLQQLPDRGAHCRILTRSGAVDVREEDAPLMVPA